MASIYDVDANELIEKAAKELAKNENIKAPEWADYVKTGVHKERAPARSDWWYLRAAAVLRTVYRYGPIGVSKLRIKYGGRKRRGHKPERFYPGSGNIIRKILQQLEKAGYLKKEEKEQHKGRKISNTGVSLLDKIATEIYKSTNPKKPAKKVEKKQIETKEAPKELPKAEEKKEIEEKEKPQLEAKAPVEKK
jgi:small subunit ribosomal protein S19e